MSETSPGDARVARQKKIGMIAKRAAEQEGQDWKALSAEDRKVYYERARQTFKEKKAAKGAKEE